MTLTDKLRARLAFDENTPLDYRKLPDDFSSPIGVEVDGKWCIDREFEAFCYGHRHENSRLQPIIEAMLKVVEAARVVRDPHGFQTVARTNEVICDLDEAIAELEKLVSE